MLQLKRNANGTKCSISNHLLLSSCHFVALFMYSFLMFVFGVSHISINPPFFVMGHVQDASFTVCHP